MFFVDAPVKSEILVADGRYDFSYEADDKKIFIGEIKYCHLASDIGEKITDKELLEVEKLALKAMKQIEDKQYTKPDRCRNAKIYKIAIVVAKRSDVCVLFKEEDKSLNDPY
jgi:hypothetical protein